MTSLQGRRRFLGIGGSALLRPSLCIPALVGPSLALVSRPASAFPWVMALSAASSLTGMMASSQAGDGGLSAAIEANLEYLRVMSKQLTSLQTGLASVMSAINQLDDKFRMALRAETALTLHNRIGAQIKNYNNEYERYSKGGFPTVGAWQIDSITVSNLQQIDFALETAVNEVDKNGFYGPLTALQLPTAMFSALAVRVGLKERTEALAIRANQYLARFDACLDEANPASTASIMNDGKAGLDKATLELADLKVPMPSGDDTTRKALFDLVGALECRGFETQPPGDCRANCTTQHHTTSVYTSRPEIFRDDSTGANQAGGLIRPLAVSEGTPVLKQRTLKPFDESAFPGALRDTVSSVKNDFGRHCPGSEEPYKKAAEALFKTDLERLQRIRKAVDVYNENLGTVALCASAIANLAVARRAVIQSFERSA